MPARGGSRGVIELFITSLSEGFRKPNYEEYVPGGLNVVEEIVCRVVVRSMRTSLRVVRAVKTCVPPESPFHVTTFTEARACALAATLRRSPEARIAVTGLSIRGTTGSGGD